MAKSAKKAASSKGASTKKTASDGAKTHHPLEASGLMQLFEHSMKDMLWAEKALTKAIPKMAENATDDELKAALEEHLTVTEGQIDKLLEVFEKIDTAPSAKKCAGMEGIITEGQEIMEEFDNELINGAIVTAASKVEHYEMSSYMSLVALAKEMGLNSAVTILQEILAEEMEADKKLQMIGKRLSKEASQV
jgi:ferritin-like metal-binding protein YciE